MDGTSLTPEQEKLNALRQILPEAFSEGKIDWEKLKATLGEDVNFSNERYVLNWAGKSDAFKVLQTPTTKTLIPAKDESVNFDQTENIFIEGENLEVLKVLQKSYFGKVKMIYIDPPYNTGNDSFIYPDKFSESKADYEKRVGDKDEEGYMTKDGMFKKNSKENGQYHSNWLNMMMPRLYLAKNLLRHDGVIFVSIDDNEIHNLRLLMNEIFGEENFVAQFVWQKKYSRDNRPLIGTVHEYILLYSKSIEEFKSVRNLLPPSEESLKVYKNLNNDPRGRWRAIPLTAQAGHATKSQFYEITTPSGIKHSPPAGRCWSVTKEKFEELLKDGRIYFGKDSNAQPNLIRYIDEIEGFVPWTWLPAKEVGHTDSAMKEFFEIMGKDAAFETPKPSTLIKHLMHIVLKENDLVLDFFSGTSTTASALYELNFEKNTRNTFINVQLDQIVEGSSRFKTIADISKERIRRTGNKISEEIEEKIKKIESQIKKLQSELPTEETKTEIENLKTKIEQLKTQDLGFKVLKLEDSNFKQWQQIEGKDAKALAEQMRLFVDPVSESATIENMVYELLLKSGKDLNSKIEKKFPSSGGVAESRGGRNAKNYFELPYNPKLKERAKELRQAGNLSEVLFWNQVKNKQFKGYDFDRQKVVGNYIVDFYCSNCNVVIEIDGSSHDNKVEYDAERDVFLGSLGLTVIHVPVAEVMNNMSGVIEMLFDHPALNLTEQKEPPRPSGTPPKEGNLELTYYVVNDGELVMMLEKATQEIIDTVIASKPNKVIALDKLFKGNDQLKTNTVLQMRDAGIEFKTI